MKVLFDHQIFSIQMYGGASKYFCEMLKRFPKEYWDIALLLSNNEYLKSLSQFTYCNPLQNTNFRGKSKLIELFNRPYSFAKLSFSNYDIFHQTHYGMYTSKLRGNRKMVMTFHDMNHTKYPDFYNINTKGIQKSQKKSIERADKIIAVSNTTKDDLINIWGIDPRKIVVIYHGIDKGRIELSERIIENPYILYVGERDGFKNFSLFIKAFSIVSEKNPTLKLVCTGKKISIEEKAQLDALKITGKVVQICADKIMMKRLYKGAEMFVFPSLSEGFGMPILEAMAQDCVVLLSNTSCFPEIANSAGVYFDPYNIDDIVDKIEQTLNSTELRAQKVKNGRDRLNMFSWEKTANQHLELYKTLC